MFNKYTNMLVLCFLDSCTHITVTHLSNREVLPHVKQ